MLTRTLELLDHLCLYVVMTAERERVFAPLIVISNPTVWGLVRQSLPAPRPAAQGPHHRGVAAAGWLWLAAYWLLAAEFARSLATPTICMETLARSPHVRRT